MKLLLLCLLVCVYCWCSAADDNCYRIETVSENCQSDQVRLKVIRGPPGKPGAKGEDGQPCRTSQESFKALQQIASGLSQNMKNRSNAFNKELTDKIKNINKTIEEKIRSDSSNEGGGYGGGNAAGFLSNGSPPIILLSSSGHPKYREAIRNRHTPVGVIIEDGVIRYDIAYTPEFITKARWLCAERGGEIASRVFSTLQKRKEFMRKLMGTNNPSYYTGVQDVLLGIQRRGGVWYYEDNTPVHLSTFGSIQQTRAGENCASLRSSTCKVHAHWCHYNRDSYGYLNQRKLHLVCYYPLRIKFKLPGKQSAFKNQLNFQQARKFCHQKGGRIALSSIKTHEKLRELVKSGKVADGEYWIGVQKIGLSAWTYQYIDEATIVEPATFPWLPNYPTFVRFGEQCAVLSVNKSTIGVKNRACGSHRPVLCEFSS